MSQHQVAPATYLALVTGADSTARVATKLIAASAWFAVTPMPDGIFAIEVRREGAVVALVQRHLAAEEEGSEGR